MGLIKTLKLIDKYTYLVGPPSSDQNELNEGETKMKLDEALKLLQQDIDDPGSVAIEDVNKAEEIGIEALERIRDDKQKGYFPEGFLLPGETEESEGEAQTPS